MDCVVDGAGDVFPSLPAPLLFGRRGDFGETCCLLTMCVVGDEDERSRYRRQPWPGQRMSRSERSPCVLLVHHDTTGTMPTDKEFPLAPLLAVKLVTPHDWDEICRDRFVFGWVVAAAFAKCDRLRVTRDGLIFENDELSDERLAEIGSMLDGEAKRAVRAQSGLMRAAGAAVSVIETFGRRDEDE